MRSKELAALAGVSVRTLRHYHQVGVLPEPERSANGYRDYTLADAALLLRIRRLAALGVPLDRMPDLLGEAGCEGRELLDDLDRELESRIDQLQAQRRVVAQLRETGLRPDHPPELGALLLATQSGASDLEDFDRDAGILVAHLAGSEAGEDVRRLVAALVDADVEGALTLAGRRFASLAPTADEAEIDGIVEGLMALVGPALGALMASPAGTRIRATDPARIPEIVDDPRLNPAQAEALRRLGERVD